MAVSSHTVTSHWDDRFAREARDKHYKEVLYRYLSDEQKADLEDYGLFVIRGKGSVHYTLWENGEANEFVPHRDAPLNARWYRSNVGDYCCINPMVGRLGYYAAILAQYLMIVAEEDVFREVRNSSLTG